MSRLLTPIIVVLREYGKIKRTSNCSILQFIELQSNANYQLSAPKGCFEHLFLNGRCLVIVDGLDELLDTSYRREISDDVESFCSLYPTVSVLVTSREVGYDQAPLDSDRFISYKIGDFDEAQCSEYADKWFDRDDDYTKQEKQQKAKAFMQESALASDLRQNPLMLGLMCNLYKLEGYIPRNRADVFEKCSIMLFERWDKSRQILVALPFEEHIRPAMQYLAYWIYSDSALHGGVTECELNRETSGYLDQWVFDNTAKARRAALEFVAFCTGRAWVFTDTGTTSDGEKLYQFTHRTFLEYFAASHLVSANPTPKQLLRVLKPRIEKEEWDVVALLAFQIQSRRNQGAADSLLSALLDSKGAPARRRARVGFAARCLQSLVPSPRIRRTVAEECFNEAMREISRSRLQLQRPRGRWSMPLVDLFTANGDNWESIAEVLEQSLVQAINGAGEERAKDCLALIADLEFLIKVNVFRVSAHEPAMLQSILPRVLSTSAATILRISKTDVSVAFMAHAFGLLSILDLIEIQGVKALFAARVLRLIEGFRNPIAYELVSQAIESENESEAVMLAEQSLAIIGDYVRLTPLPLILRHEAMGPYFRPYSDSRWLKIGKRELTNPRAVFGIIVLLAVAAEIHKGSVSVRKSEHRHSFWVSSSQLADYREQLDAEDAAFIQSWVSGAINFIDPVATE
jgi:hypothetical protein